MGVSRTAQPLACGLLPVAVPRSAARDRAGGDDAFRGGRDARECHLPILLCSAGVAAADQPAVPERPVRVPDRVGRGTVLSLAQDDSPRVRHERADLPLRHAAVFFLTPHPAPLPLSRRERHGTCASPSARPGPRD